MSYAECGGENSTCKVFYSCANIKIRPTPVGQSRNLSSCSNYLDNLMGPWPYTPPTDLQDLLASCLNHKLSKHQSGTRPQAVHVDALSMNLDCIVWGHSWLPRHSDDASLGMLEGCSIPAVGNPIKLDNIDQIVCQGKQISVNGWFHFVHLEEVAWSYSGFKCQKGCSPGLENQTKGTENNEEPGTLQMRPDLLQAKVWKRSGELQTELPPETAALDEWPALTDVTSKQNATNEPLVFGRFDPYRKDLNLDIPLQTTDRDSVQRIHIVFVDELGNTTELFSYNITRANYVDNNVAIVWSGISSENVARLESADLTVVVTFKEGERNGTLKLSKEYNKLRHYNALFSPYTTEGWLSGRKFLGPSSKYPNYVEPVGPCVQLPHNYVAFLHLHELQNDFHGVVAVSFLDHRAYITAAVHGLDKPIESVHLLGPELGGSPSFFVTKQDDDSPFINTIVNVTSQIPYIGSVRFLKTVVLRTLDMLIDGNLQQAMHCILKMNSKVYGVGGFQFTKGRWLTFEILLKNIQTNITSVTLDGPATWGVNGATMYSLTDNIVNSKTGDYVVKGRLKDLSSEFLLALWKGWISVKVKATGDNIIEGKLSSPGIWYCTQLEGAPCPLVNMLPIDTVFVDEGAEKVPAMGLGAFVLDRVDVLQYSILVENIPKKAERSVTANLTILTTNISITLELHPSQDRVKAYKAHGKVPESTQAMIQALASGLLKLVIHSPVIGKKPFNVSLPTITRDLCTSPKDFFIGESDHFWSVGDKDLPSVYALVGDRLVFKYSSNHSVYLMASKSAYNSCNFTDATMLEGPAENTTHHLHPLRKAGRLYFASQLDCNATPPVKVMVTVVEGVAPQTADLDDCGDSLYDIWRKQKLSKFTPPNPIGSAFGGIIVGLILLALFVVWDRRVNQKKSGNLALFERF
ncbi:uncharacterized protein LOC124285946 [Haliotis rubra]|uniref:uncharacterized protein LOC124285946 n=1 Tax=Haliotis rubra TaxID=36100 RepID=UPI001EE607B3|nr:uncharacterized protein LOC124285946 [Haliotis rubra]